MKKNYFLVFILALAFSLSAFSQYGQIGIIGTTNGWAAPDHMLTRDLVNPYFYTTIITIAAGDTNAETGVREIKFRENEEWTNNWGGDDFPSGIATKGGANIDSMDAGTYYVEFNAETGAYNFTLTTGSIGIVGTINGWSPPDHQMTRDAVKLDEWTTIITIAAGDTNNDTGVREIKFRENEEWTNNWGGDDFPSGIATIGGANIDSMDAGTYFVEFNTTTGAYSFTATTGSIGIVGTTNGWSPPDHQLTRDAVNLDEWTTIITIAAGDTNAETGVREIKFRENEEWTNNWGGADFPSGIATIGGPNIDSMDAGTYFVEFNTTTGAYTFTSTAGDISLIGDFNGWAGDFALTRDAADPDVWSGARSLRHSGGLKFRENASWDVAWGFDAWPSGTAVTGSSAKNIPAVAGIYDINFNSSTGVFSFVPNNSIPADISIVGDFNDFGAPGGENEGPDIQLTRDPIVATYFTATHNFEASANIFFRQNESDVLPTNTDSIWGGARFPVGMADVGIAKPIAIPGGLYYITYDFNSGAYSFTQLGNSVKAPKVFALTVDGVTSEPDWIIETPVGRVVDGTAPEALAEVFFGAAYNSELLYVAVEIEDATPTNELVHVFIDGDKSGGAYDEHDVHFTVASDGTATLITPTSGVTVVAAATTSATTLTVEASVLWADLDVTANEGEGVKFDILIEADDSTYVLGWNGGLQNLVSLSSLGDLSFSGLACGNIAAYSSTIGDIRLRTADASPTTYLATFNLAADDNLVFRKDKSNTVAWGDNDADGNAVLGEDAFAVTAGRYRISFDCLSGDYTFTDDATITALSHYTETAEPVDGDVSTYDLDYASDMLADGDGPINNTVTWGMKWSHDTLYFAASIIDSPVEGSGNPWDNDAIELYIDGNHDQDGPLDANFDTQLIMDNGSNQEADGVNKLWIKADGVPIAEDDFSSKWLLTSDGYIVEVALAWSIFDFEAGSGRTMGFSLGNNDSDKGVGRDYQSVWVGDGNNWSSTVNLGDIELVGGSISDAINEVNESLASVSIYPNPTSGDINLRFTEATSATIEISNITGQIVKVQNVYDINTVNLDLSNISAGLYFVQVKVAQGDVQLIKFIKN